MQARVEAVRKFREASTALPTQRAAERPAQFFYDGQPPAEYIFVPEVSSERRRYVPIGLLGPDIIASNKGYLVPTNDLFLFGLLSSMMHMAWLKTVGGRLESRFQYSATIVYNTFPWPRLTVPQRSAIELAAKALLSARAAHPDATLADLYDPLSMPPNLVAAHRKLDQAVDAAYGAPRGGWGTEAQRLAFLFTLYEAQAVDAQRTFVLPRGKAKPKRLQRKAQTKLIPPKRGPGDKSPGG